MTLQFGMFVPQGWRTDLIEISDPIEKYEAMTRVAKAADALDIYDSIWVYDHFHTVPQPIQEAVFECWTITAALARDTQRVNIGQMCTCNGYRNPALLAKIASTIDVLSHGRLYCGYGAGWYEHEWRAYGYGFPETSERMRAFREGCEILYKMWTEDRPSFEGQYYQINEPINEPKGVRKPHVSFWIAGGGEQVTLRLVAKYGNASNFGGKPEQVKHKLDVLRQHCDKLGRDYNEITRSSNVNVVLLKNGEDPVQATAKLRETYGWSYEELTKQMVVGTSQQVAEHMQGLVDAGINYLISYFPRIAYNQEPLYQFAEEVAPLLKG
jgi:F420-dependent oxidoreductase-like protein